jgi:hypothetical protein
MPTTYEAIATVTVGSGGAANMTFSSIPQTYTDLVIKISGRSAFTTNTYDDIRFEFNGSAGTAYTTRMIYGDGASALSTVTANIGNIAWAFVSNANATANTFGNAEVYIPNYAGSTNKSVSLDSASETNGTTAIAALAAGIWANTAAITSIKMTNISGTNFVQYSTATLYGIKSS